MSVGGFRSVIGVAILAVHWHDLSPRRSVALQLIGHHHPWRSTLVLQHITEESLRGLFVFTFMNQNVDDVIVLVNSTPEITAFPLGP